MMRLFFTFLSFSFFLFSASAVYAIGDDFRIRTLVGSDLVAPSTPTLTSATPVATTQIDLVWTESTDDFIFGGYQVFRDTVQIATTTLTSYSDTGLIASTTYSYYVTAFDSSYNVSSSSNTIATTTFSLPATSTPPTDNDSGGGGYVVQLDSLEIVPGMYDAKLTWETNRFAQFQLRWGRSTSYELGFVNNDVFKKKHTTFIADLEPGTTYEYELIAYDRNGVRYLLSEGQFKTLDAPDVTAPSNVANLTGTIRGADIILSWANPLDSDFSHVRIVRSPMFYPSDPYDGFIAYVGDGITLIDRKAASQSDVQYYTVFSYDENGNISSGAVVRVVASGTSVDTQVSEEAKLTFTFDDIEIVQKGSVVSHDEVDGDDPFVLRVAYDKFPEHLKTIVAKLTNPNDKEVSQTHLLRVNNDKTYYEANIPALGYAGVYPLLLTVFDFEASLLHEVAGSLTVFIDGEEVFLGVPLSTQASDVVKQSTLWWLLLLLLLLLWLFLLLRSLFVGKQTSKTLQGARLAALLLCTGVAGSVAYVLFTSSSAPTPATVQASLLQAPVPLETVTVLAVISVLLAFGVLVLLTLTYAVRNKKK